MHKIALTAVASAAILCSGSLLSDRAEAMTLGGTAAGVRIAVQDVSSVSDVRYYRKRWRHRHYHGHHHHGGHGYAVPAWDVAPWYWEPGHRPTPYYVRGEVGVRYGAWCWRETDGSRPFGYYNLCPRR